uniref:Uncharacterized protein n=1 Tax=Oryza sativa subsp. japonica TaxID=39947 RepID=Q6Z5T2_ORYSJ|nr:hypothetical protein [Oryza sativa Japonica Group]
MTTAAVDGDLDFGGDGCTDGGPNEGWRYRLDLVVAAAVLWMRALGACGGGGRSGSPRRHTIWWRRRPKPMVVVPGASRVDEESAGGERERGGREHLACGPRLEMQFCLANFWPLRALVWPSRWLGHPVGKTVRARFCSIVSKF